MKQQTADYKQFQETSCEVDKPLIQTLVLDRVIGDTRSRKKFSVRNLKLKYGGTRNIQFKQSSLDKMRNSY